MAALKVTPALSTLMTNAIESETISDENRDTLRIALQSANISISVLKLAMENQSVGIPVLDLKKMLTGSTVTFPRLKQRATSTVEPESATIAEERCKRRAKLLLAQECRQYNQMVHGSDK